MANRRVKKQIVAKRIKRNRIILILVLIFLLVNINALFFILAQKTEKTSDNATSIPAKTDSVENNKTNINVIKSISGFFKSIVSRISNVSSPIRAKNNFSSEVNSSSGLNVDNRLYFEPLSQNIAVNQESSVNLKLSTKDAYAVSLEIYFDRNTIEVEKVNEGSFLRNGASTYPVISIDNNLGKISFAITRFNTQNGISGDGILAEINFKAKSSGTSNLEVKNYKVTDQSLNEIDVTSDVGKIIVG